MSSIKVLIVEDEELISEDIANKLTEFGYEITDCVDNCESAVASVKKNEPDIIFLDIMINGPKNGIETAKELKTIVEFPIIFLTSVSEDSLLRKAMDTKPANYLRKPFTAEQLHVCIQTALYNVAKKKTANLNEEVVEIPETLVNNDELFLKDGNGTYHKYNINEILFIKADRAYSDIYLKKGNKLKQTTNMKDMSEKIDHPNLIKAHRSYIVNIANIDGIRGNELLFGEERVAISEPFKQEIYKRLKLL